MRAHMRTRLAHRVRQMFGNMNFHSGSKHMHAGDVQAVLRALLPDTQAKDLLRLSRDAVTVMPTLGLSQCIAALLRRRAS